MKPAKLWVLIAIMGLASVVRGEDPPVTIREDGRSYTLQNSHITATINKTTGDLTSLLYKNIELLGHGSGHPAGYWEQTPADAPRCVVAQTIDPARNNGDRAEVSIKGFSEGTALGGQGQPGGAMMCDIELRYCLGRQDHGLYAYAIYDHPPTYSATSIGESRFAAKLNSTVFDWMSIDEKRDRLMPSGFDWDHGTPTNMKEARRLTTGPYAGQVEHKYDYSAIQFNTPAFGWSSTKQNVGLYFINPSAEYLSGGATKVELTGHLDNGDGGDPTLLNYWRGTHYGGSNCSIAAGENWSRVVGPMLIYINSGASPRAMFKDALTQAKREAAAWPYDWVSGVDYPKKADRATVTGALALKDPLAPKPQARFSNLLVGLVSPELRPATSPIARGRGMPAPVIDWQNDAKHYQFWTRGDADGRFSIPSVRPGAYQLRAIADGILGEFACAIPITLKPGQPIDLGTLDWKPLRCGRQLWEIGIPNRSGSEFFKGDDYFHWGIYLEYAKLFPADVIFTIGKSDPCKDWFFQQVPHNTDPANTTSQGRATPWTIAFDLDHAPAARGRATLRVAIAASDARSVAITINDQSAGAITGLIPSSTINRDGIQGYWTERSIPFDAALLKSGRNTLVLTVPAGPLTAGIIYDYLRLELDENPAAGG